MRTQWNTTSGSTWVTERTLFDAVLDGVNAEILARVGDLTGARVLDVGCGTGSLTRAAIAGGAQVTGVDISEPMITAAAQNPVAGAAFTVADAQIDDLTGLPGAPFSRVVSRFGVMFFDDPVAAFANIREAAEPGATLTFACWRSAAENPQFTLGTRVLVERMPEPPPPADPDAPGPLAFADPERVTALLTTAGWSGIGIDPADLVGDYGFDGSDGVANRLTMALGTSAGAAATKQLRAVLSTDEWEAVLDDVRADIAGAKVDGVVRMPMRVWLVSATA